MSAGEFNENHGRAALKIIGAVILAVVVVLPILNSLFGSFLPTATITV